MSNLTTNFNFLSPTGFKLVINRNRFANLEYFATSVTLPSLSLGTIDIAKNQHRGHMQGDVTIDELSVRVAVDEDLEVYKEVFEWIIENRDSLNPLTYDATLIILTSHNNANKSIKFKNIFPTSVGSLEFSTQSSDIEYLQADIGFRYDEFEFV
jgi:hypothetical protein